MRKASNLNALDAVKVRHGKLDSIIRQFFAPTGLCCGGGRLGSVSRSTKDGKKIGFGHCIASGLPNDRVGGQIEQKHGLLGLFHLEPRIATNNLDLACDHNDVARNTRINKIFSCFALHRARNAAANSVLPPITTMPNRTFFESQTQSRADHRRQSLAREWFENPPSRIRTSIRTSIYDMGTKNGKKRRRPNKPACLVTHAAAKRTGCGIRGFRSELVVQIYLS